MASPPRIFISMGTPYSPQHTSFRDELEAMLRDQCKVDPRIIGKNEYPSGSPLEHIRQVMKSCSGIIVVAYERKYLESGTEKRGGPAAQKLSKRAYTTPWNHIESALAYSFELPLYILCQNGLVEEGLIETKSDWFVQKVNIDAGALSQPEVAASIRAWVDSRVVPRSKKRGATMKALSGKAKISEMSPAEIASFVGMLGFAFLCGVGATIFFPRFIDLIRH